MGAPFPPLVNDYDKLRNQCWGNKRNIDYPPRRYLGVFPKWESPVVTMGFNTISWSFVTWMIWGYPGDLGHLHFLGDRTLTVKPRISCLPEIGALPKGLELQEPGSSRNLLVIIRKLLNSHGSIPMKIPFWVGWTSIYQLFWSSLGTRVLTHPHMETYGNIWPIEIHLPSGYDIHSSPWKDPPCYW